ncbi:MAG: NTP transferase domain-containing protein [Bacteroidetes bacterium]|nr:NTP transferase domain-containing protein [Bacteroidota bacterium]
MINTAIILAGGFGTRLQSVVSDLPKPMAPVNDQPFLNYQLAYLKHFGITHVIISTGYLADKIHSYYGKEFQGMQISYSHEEKPLGTGGGIRLAFEKCTDEIALVLNGDSFFDVSIEQLYALHCEQHAEFSLALRQVEDASRYGTIERGEANRIISFHEKHGLSKPGLINGGVYILDKKLYFEKTAGLVAFSIEKDFFEKQLHNLSIKGFEFKGYFIDIGMPEDYTKAQNDFKEFKY